LSLFSYYGFMSLQQKELEQATEKFVHYLKSQKLKLTQQRLEVLEHFLGTREHVSADELYQELREVNPKIGFSTVYRTLKLLSDSGIAKENYFRDGFTRYENDFNRDHHDHIICTDCNEIFEFENREIEELQCMVAKNLGFKIVDHQLEIYAKCNKFPNCPNNKEK